jgi:malonyl CoA-acyl carrier protein transacylase
LLPLILGTADDPDLLHQTLYTQPALFAVEVALYQLLTTHGVTPDHLVGHSIGELSAAHAAGILNLTDAALLVTTRARLMQHHSTPGGLMAAINTDEQTIRAALTDRVSIAAVNSPTSTVISGDPDTVTTLTNTFREQGVRTRNLTVSHAFHSHHMDPLLDELTAVANTLTYHPPTIPIISTLTGQPDTDLTDPTYWARQVRGTVRYTDAITHLTTVRTTTYLELGPDPVLAPMTLECLSGVPNGPHEAPSLVTPVMRRDQPETRTVLAVLAQLWVRGTHIEWSDSPALPATGRAVQLPTYTFERERYWLDVGTTVTGSATRHSSEHQLWTAVENQDLATAASVLGVGAADRDALKTLLPTLSAWRRRRHWGYRFAWVPIDEPATGLLTGTWVVASAGRSPSEQILREHGADVVHLDLTAHPDLDRLADRVKEAAAGAAIAGMLLVSDAPDEGAAWQPAGLVSRSVRDAGIDAPLWLVTRGAVTAVGGDEADQRQSRHRTALLEAARSGSGIGLLDLPLRPLDARTGARIAAVLGRESGPDDVAVRTSGSYARRLLPAMLEPEGDEPRPWTAGTVLITEGTHGLGAQVARSLAGAGHLLLTVGGERDEAETEELLSDLRSAGSAVTVVATGLRDPGELQGLVTGLPADRPLTAVVHTTGVKTAEDPSVAVDQAYRLDEATRDRDVAAFIVFSAAADALGLGRPGDVTHLRLSEVVRQRRLAGLPALSVAWGPWTGSVPGSAAGPWDHAGLRALDASHGLPLVWHAAGKGEPDVAVLDLDPALPADDCPPLLGALSEAAQPTGAIEPTGGIDDPRALRRRLALSETAEEREILLLELVRTHAANVLGHSSTDAIDIGSEFLDLGFSSFTALELRNLLAASTGLDLPPVVIFELRTPLALTEFLHTSLTTIPDDLATAGR